MTKPQIEQVYIIEASIGDVWDALINPVQIEKWSGGPATMSDEEGFEFSLWDGDVYGENTLVEEPDMLEQDWYGGDWDKPSKVKFELTEDEVENFSEGWKDYYLGSLKEMFEG